MIRVGILGYGSMGRMLVDGFITSGSLKPDEIIVSNRSREKLSLLKEKWPAIQIAENNSEAVKKAKILFICVKPLEVRDMLLEVKRHLSQDKHLVTITGCVTLNDIGTIFDGSISKVIPSLTSEVKEGVSLICHNGKVSKESAAAVESLLSAISKVMIIEEKNFEPASDLTSCAPGMIASIFQEFLEVGLRHSSLGRKDAEEMVVRTLYGTAKLFLEKNMSFDETIERVATKGGITEEGVKVLRAGLPAVFDEVFAKTLGKHEDRKAKIREQFGQN